MIFSKLKKWYFSTFLPFENPYHPLNTSYQTDTFIDELSDWVDRELEERDEGYIGPNYERKPFSKPTKYEKWGNKWYKKH